MNGLSSGFELVKIITSNTKSHIINNLNQLNIIPENKFNQFINSRHFNRLVDKEKAIRTHPFFIKKMDETDNKIVIMAVNTTHSSNNIKINKQLVTTTQVASYWKDGEEKKQYLINASCIIELQKNEYYKLIQNVSNDPDEVKKLGGIENIKKIQEKLENEWNNKPRFYYIDNLRTTIKSSFEIFEQQEQYNVNHENKINQPYE